MGAGGAIFVTSGRLTMTNVLLTNNSATGGTVASPGAGLGGAIFLFNKADNGGTAAPGTTNDPTVSACALTFSGNTATYQNNQPGVNDNNQYGAFPVAPGVTLTQQPVSSSTVIVGDNVQVPVGISGTPTGYQWYQDGVPVSGQTSATLNLTNVQLGQAGNYTLVATSACNSVTSTAFSLTVLSIAITQQPPAGLVATIGDNVQVPVGIRGVVTGYQWYKDGVLVSGQTSATLNLTNVQRAQAGNYTLVATSATNSVTTTALNLVVNAPPALVQGTKTVAGDFTPGGTITYTIILANSGAGGQPDAPDRELFDVLDAGLVLVSTTATSGQARAIDASSMEWNGSIPAGRQVTITITATILADPTLIGQPIVNHPGFIYDSDGDGLNDRPRRTDDPTTPAPNDATVFVVACPAQALVLSNDGPLGCAKATVTLTASGASQGSTYVFSGGASPVGNTATVSMGGLYSVTATAPNGCTATATTAVSVIAPPTVSINPTSATLTCASPAISLTAIGTGSVRWSTGSTSPVISVSTAGTYSVTLTSADGCTATASTTISVDQTAPTVSISPTSATLSCASPTVNLTAVGSGAVRWSTGETTPIISVSVAGPYSVTLTGSNGCATSATATITSTTVTLTVSSPLVATAQQGQPFSQTFTAQGGSDPYRFSALSSNLPTSLSLSPTGVLSGTPTQVGSFTIIVGATDQNGCTGTSASYRLTVNELRLPIRYVKPVASGTGDGSSWANASGDLQTMIIAPGVEQVWVAGGLYKPTTGANRTISFYMKEAVAIYGGFVGMETTLNQRPVINPVGGRPSSTTLSGDIGTVGDNSDNTYHVISNFGNFGVDLTSRTVLDGFVITGGGGAQGGGIFNVGSNPTITNCSLVGNAGNQGGGMYISGCSPTLTTVMFENNVSTGEGGGLFNTSSNPILTNCRFQNNQSANYGGAIYNVDSRPSLTNCSLEANTAVLGGAIAVLGNSQATLTNCSLQSNTATVTGGVFFIDNSDLLLTNCSFQRNVSSVGSGNVLVAQNGGRRVLTNCVVYGNGVGTAFEAPVEASYCLFENTVTNYAGSNNRTTSVSPFVSSASVVLNSCAPAINAGNNDAYAAANGPGVDLAGNPRIVGDVIDMGAVEFQDTPNTQTAFIQLPASATGCVGSSLSIPFSVSGTGPFSVQLYRQGVAVGPAQSSTVLSFTSLQLSDAGSYSVVVTGSCNSVTSTAFNLTVTSQSPDYQPLVDLFNATNGPNWTSKNNWLTGCSPCGWYGVSCDGNGRVKKVDLRFNNLQGTIPASLSALVVLQELSLQNNLLSGSVPSALANLSDLKILNLGQNQFSGPVPGSLSALTGLQVGYFNNNQLSGCFPASLSAVCGKLQFGGNPGLPGGGDFNAFCARGAGSDAFAPLASASPNPVCAGSPVSLSVSAGTSYAWSGPGGFVATTQRTGFTATGSSSGIYSVTVGNGSATCTATASTSLTVSEPPILTIVGLASRFCADMPPVALTGNPVGGSFTIDGAPATTLTPASLSVGQHTVVYSYTSTGSCPATISQSVTINSLPTASLLASGTLSCGQTSVTLTAGGGSTYVFGAGATQLGTSNQAVVSASGTYSVTVLSANGCSAVATTTVTGDQSVPTASLTNDGPLSCSKTSVTLTASGGGTYRFSNGASQIGSTNQATVNTAGTYSVTVTAGNGCSAMAQTTVTGDQSVPEVSLTNNGPLSCTMSTVTLTASPQGQSYRFSAGATQVGSGNTATLNTAGTYSVTVTSGNGCSAVAQTTVIGDQTAPSVSITANPSLTITQGQSATLTASGGAGQPAVTYGWNNGANTPAIVVSTAGPYSVTGTSANGCTGTASLMLTVIPVVTAPFAITGVTTVDCTPVLPNRISISFTPRYSGLDGSPVSFSVTNELFPTTNPGPYTLQLYTDNPTITLEARQSGATTKYTYDWLAACNSSTAPNTPPRVIRGIPAQTATVGQYFSYVIPEGTFTDTETPGSLRLSASGVPAGLSFSGATLSGTPSSTVGSPVSITITATDPGNLSASTTLMLTVQPATGTPPPTMPFAITGVTTISCTPVANRINIVFSPRYQGMSGQPIAFEVVNELAPTTDPAPYSLTLYRDNPVITLRATQTGSPGPVTFSYNWLAACASAGQENTPPRLNEPVKPQSATVGVQYSLNLSNTFIDQETPDQITLTSSALPAGLTLSGKMISGTPSMSGVTSVTLTATDGGGLSSSTSFRITVSPGNPPPPNPPSAPFSITGVTTVSCEVISAGQRRVTFSPRYAGVNGSPISFSVVNELTPTTNPGPYTLNLYTDNPVITFECSAERGGE